MRVKLKARIVLKSDLCVGSGYSYAGIIDSDVCYNEYGIPYIPARRLKGCLRESAELINSPLIDEIFGISGNNRSGSLQLSNGYLSYNDELINQLLYVKEKINDETFNVQAVLKQLTTIKAQTAIDIDTGKAKDDTLRFIRIINHYSKDNSENEFVLSLYIDEEYKEELKRIFKALRHIGLDRNRGLGSVRCFVEDSDDTNNISNNKYEVDDHKTYIINYSIRNVLPLMLSNDNDGKSETYISGQSVLGYFASKHPVIDEEFENMFLKGEIIYSNLYPEIVYEDKKYRTVPTVEFINKLKKSKDIVNTLFDEKIEAGNQPKKLNGYYYYSIDNKRIKLVQPELDVAYHHSKKQDGILYSLTKLKENQRYTGYIICKGKYVGFIIDNLNNQPIYFGKSKSSEYGQCLVEEISYKELENKTTNYQANEIIVVALDSDAIFIDDNLGAYTTDPKVVKDILAKQLNIEYVNVDDMADYVSSKYITGYNTKWNLKKPSFSAIKAGSCFVYKLTKDITINRKFVGEKNHEGYGEISLQKLADMQYELESVKDDKEYKNIKIDSFRVEIASILLDSIYTTLFDDAIKTQKELKINPSLLGRVILMVKQSKDKKDLIDRIESIKSKNEKTKILNFIQEAIGKDDNQITLKLENNKEYEKLKNDDTLKNLYDAVDVTNKWKEYLIMLLTQEKYLNKSYDAIKEEDDE